MRYVNLKAIRILSKKNIFIMTFINIISLLLLVFIYNNTDVLEEKIKSEQKLISNIITNIKEAQTSQYGYLLTKNYDYIDIYNTSIKNTQEKLNELSNLSEIRTQRVSVLNELSKLINQKIVKMNKIMKMANDGKKLEAIKLLNKEFIQRKMQKIRMLVAQYDFDSNKEYENFTQMKDKLFKFFIALIVFEIVIIFILLMRNLKSLEKQKIQKKILSEQTKMAQMGEMIGNIAHQWRQPLSAISSSASGMKVSNQLGLLSSKDINKNLDLIILKTNYLSETINTFRNFLKDDKVVKELILEDLLQNSIDIVKANLNRDHISFFNEIDKTKQTKMIMVSSELPQVIINIINNSKDALYEKNIKDKWIKLSLYILEEKAIITIEDNAGGIPKDVLPRIFEPYFTTKHQSQGTGLGLHMSYKIVKESLKGDIYASNTQDGALFTIELPLSTKI